MAAVRLDVDVETDRGLDRMRLEQGLDAEHQAELLVDRGWGPAQVRAKLMQHGVSSSLAADTVDRLGAHWVDVARARLRQKFGELEEGDRERAYRHLVYRGFAPAVARSAIFD